MISLRSLFLAVAVLFVGNALAAPSIESAVTAKTGNDTHTPVAISVVPGAPRFVVYSDQGVPSQKGPPPVSQIKVRRSYDVLSRAAAH